MSLRDERGRGRPLGLAAGAQLRVWVQCTQDPPPVLLLLHVQGAAEGRGAGVTDASRDPGYEAGALHRQHDGRVPDTPGWRERSTR